MNPTEIVIRSIPGAKRNVRLTDSLQTEIMKPDGDMIVVTALRSYSAALGQVLTLRSIRKTSVVMIACQTPTVDDRVSEDRMRICRRMCSEYRIPVGFFRDTPPEKYEVPPRETLLEDNPGGVTVVAEKKSEKGGEKWRD